MSFSGGFFFLQLQNSRLLKNKTKMSSLKIAVQKAEDYSEDSIKLQRLRNFLWQRKRPIKSSGRKFSDWAFLPQKFRYSSVHRRWSSRCSHCWRKSTHRKQKDIEIVQKLGFSKCRVSLAVPKDIETNDLQYFQGKKLQLLIPIPLKLFFRK